MPAPRVLVIGEDALARAGLRSLAESAGLTVSDDVPPSALDDETVDRAEAAVWDVGAHGAAEGLRSLSRRLPVVPLLDEEGVGRSLPLRLLRAGEERDATVEVGERGAA